MNDTEHAARSTNSSIMVEAPEYVIYSNIHLTDIEQHIIPNLRSAQPWEVLNMFNMFHRIGPWKIGSLILNYIVYI